jgi:hypothetical protein
VSEEDALIIGAQAKFDEAHPTLELGPVLPEVNQVRPEFDAIVGDSQRNAGIPLWQVVLQRLLQLGG